MDFLLLGNDPFLDFVNTRPFHEGQFHEQLGDGASLLNLLGRLDLTGVPPLRGVAASEADLAAQQARSLREDARTLLFQLRGDSQGDLAVLNSWLDRLGHYELTRESGQINLGYQPDSSLPEARWLAPILQMGVRLLTSPKAGRIRKCANPECVLWYLDTTKSGTRRWCSMAMCGNVDKARTFRQRHRIGKTS